MRRTKLALTKTGAASLRLPTCYECDVEVELAPAERARYAL